jgi:carbon storage regulator CsrA
MLVLSRRKNEKLVFPNLGIEIEIVHVAGKVVRVGIDAPNNIRVLRGELYSGNPGSDSNQESGTPVSAHPESSREQRHAHRNRVNRALLGLQVLQANIEAGNTEDLESLIYKIFQNLQDLNLELDNAVAKDRPRMKTEQRPRALIVDDNRNEAELLAQYLELNGYASFVVENGREAITWLKQHEHPDVVLMDMNMPEMDGAEAIQMIREDRSLNDLRVIGVSGLDQDEVGIEFGERGVDGWFTKPVDARRLMTAIREPGAGDVPTMWAESTR